MDQRRLGKTGLKVSEVGFGCGDVGGLMTLGEPGERVRAVARAMELGINYFDTAPVYADGLSERNLGDVLKELRSEVHVSTKVRIPADGMQDIKASVFRSVEESLKRLSRDHVDLIQLHSNVGWQRNVAEGSISVQDVLGEVVEAFQYLQVQGKARYYGITGLGETESLYRVVDSDAFQTVQACYNLLNPSAGESVPPNLNPQDFGRLIVRAAEREMGVIVIGVLAQGALSGLEGRHPVAKASTAAIGTGRDYMEDVRRARSFDFLVNEGYVEGLVEASLRFALANEHVSSVLVGYSSLEHLEKAVEYASRGPLPPEALDRLPEVWAELARG